MVRVQWNDGGMADKIPPFEWKKSEKFALEKNMNIIQSMLEASDEFHENLCLFREEILASGKGEKVHYSHSTMAYLGLLSELRKSLVTALQASYEIDGVFEKRIKEEMEKDGSYYYF